MGSWSTAPTCLLGLAFFSQTQKLKVFLLGLFILFLFGYGLILIRLHVS